MKTRKRGHRLFNNNPRGKPITYKTGYGSANKARRTLRKIHKKPKSYQRQVATTMYYRAKYHKHQTNGMKNAEMIYKKFLNTLKKNKKMKSKIKKRER